MVNLFISIYPESDISRRNELETCLALNIRNPLIDRIFILEEGDHNFHTQHEKVILLSINARPTFSSIFEIINGVSSDEDINIIANLDIYFDEYSIKNLQNNLQPYHCYALTRYNIIENNPVFFDRRDSQDTWCFKGKVSLSIYADFGLGLPGCDNRLAYQLQHAGYTVSNPSLTVKSYHLHASDNRNWYGKEQIEPPYLLLDPCEL